MQQLLQRMTVMILLLQSWMPANRSHMLRCSSSSSVCSWQLRGHLSHLLSNDCLMSMQWWLQLLGQQNQPTRVH